MWHFWILSYQSDLYLNCVLHVARDYHVTMHYTVEQEILWDPIFTVFVDDHLTAKIKPSNKLDCTVQNGRECTRPWELDLQNIIKIGHPWKMNPAKISRYIYGSHLMHASEGHGHAHTMCCHINLMTCHILCIAWCIPWGRGEWDHNCTD